MNNRLGHSGTTNSVAFRKVVATQPCMVTVRHEPTSYIYSVFVLGVYSSWDLRSARICFPFGDRIMHAGHASQGRASLLESGYMGNPMDARWPAQDAPGKMEVHRFHLAANTSLALFQYKLFAFIYLGPTQRAILCCELLETLICWVCCSAVVVFVASSAIFFRLQQYGTSWHRSGR